MAAMTRLVLLMASLTGSVSSFVLAPSVVVNKLPTSLSMVDPSLFVDQAVSSIMLAETEPWVQPLSLVLDPFLNLFSFAMVRFRLGEWCLWRYTTQLNQADRDVYYDTHHFSHSTTTTMHSTRSYVASSWVGIRIHHCGRCHGFSLRGQLSFCWDQFEMPSLLPLELTSHPLCGWVSLPLCMKYCLDNRDSWPWRLSMEFKRLRHTVVGKMGWDDDSDDVKTSATEITTTQEVPVVFVVAIALVRSSDRHGKLILEGCIVTDDSIPCFWLFTCFRTWCLSPCLVQIM